MSGDIPPAAPADALRHDITDDEVDALLEKVEAGAAPVADVLPGVARPHDLVAREGAVRGRMPVLDRVNARWVGDFQQQLADLVRQPLEVTLRDVQLTPYAEWQARIPAPSSVVVYTVSPWSRQAIVTIEGQLLFMLVDAYYGGVGGAAGSRSQTTLTPTETRLTAVLAEALATHFQQAFEPISPLQLEHAKTESNAQYVTIATPSETVVVTHVDVALNGAGGSIYLVFPLAAFDSVREKLAEGVKAGSAEGRQRWRQSFESLLDATQLQLAAVFLETELSVRELLRMRPGDILPIEMPKTATLYAGARPLLAGKFGQSRGYNAISVVEAIAADGK